MTLTPLLVDAKKEYVRQLADVLGPHVLIVIARIFESSKRSTSAFQRQLQQIQNWNATHVEERAAEIERRHPELQDLIAACCVSYTKVLGSIRLNQSQASNIRVALPAAPKFVHTVYMFVAKEFYYDPKLVYATRSTKEAIMREAVEEAVREHVPMQQLLKAYLTVAVDSGGLDPVAASYDDAPGSPPAPAAPERPASPPPPPAVSPVRMSPVRMSPVRMSPEPEPMPELLHVPPLGQPLGQMSQMPQMHQAPPQMHQAPQQMHQLPPMPQVPQVQQPQHPLPNLFDDDLADFA